MGEKGGADMLHELLHGEQELISTFDPVMYGKVTALLQAARIRYRVKATNNGSGANRRSLLGSFGENPALQTQYQIFVKKQDYALASYQLRNAR